jgi:succinate-semialdehyde dehydrogenase/glutarate-semialdehyde dehydrogenase
MMLKSFDPSNDEFIGEVPITPASAIPEMTTGAAQAQKSWRETAVDERISYIAQASKLVEDNAEELAVLLSQEMGKDMRRSYSEVMGCAQGAPYIADQVREAIQSKQVNGATLEYVPLGVAAVISPWNYPLAMANNLLVPALVAGNTVLFKPSQETPLIADAYVALLNQILPDNVLQIIHGGKEQGQAIVEADINIIAFTGSMATGKDIMRRASGSLKRLIMELGGNDPMIVLDDADIDRAAQFAVASSFENAGQMCTSTERIYVDEKIADAFEQRTAAIAAQYQIGPWNQEGVNIGPIINKHQRGKIIEHIDDAINKGARILLGGTDHPEHFIKPTVLADVTAEMRMESEETFGPVVSISRYKNIDDAIERANDSEYGLGAVVFGGASATDVGRQIQAGMIGINSGVGAGGDTPWVGAKQSGYGFHGSADGHRQFTQVRVIS